MIKKTVSLLSVLFLSVTLFSVIASATDVVLREADIYLPQVSVALKGNADEEDIDFVKLGSEKLGNIKKAENPKRLTYILIDISTSVSQSYIDSLKPSLIDYAKHFDKDDEKLVLVTFGEKTTTLLSGGESDSAIENAFNSVQCNAQNTTFYQALNYVYKLAQKEHEYDVKNAVVVSDGTDIDVGNSSQQEVIDNFKERSLPVYAFCLDTADKSSSDGFGYIARNSGGELVTFSSYNAESRFDELKSIIENISVFTMKSENKKTVSNETLTLSVNGVKTEQAVSVRAQSDGKAPYVKSVGFDVDTNSFLIEFSENVENADKASAFKISSASGRELTVKSVKYDDNISTVCMNDTVYSGEYTFNFISVTDSSDNMNEVSPDTITETVVAKAVIFKILIFVLPVLGVIALLLAVYLILKNIQKKKNVKRIRDIFVEQIEEEQHEIVHITENKGTYIKLYVSCSNGTNREIEYNVVSSVIFGRSDMCDIRIDDPLLSRQHFAIEKLENGLALTDLNSVNGTYLNGVRIDSRTFLPDGSRISAGNSIIRIVIEG